MENGDSFQKQKRDYLEPKIGATNVSDRPILRWAPIDDVLEYNICISPEPDFDNPGTREYTSRIPELDLSKILKKSESLESNTKYYWRVNAKFQSGISDWVVSYFKTLSQAGKNLYIIIASITYPLLLIGVFMYAYNYMVALIENKATSNPLELAGVAGTIGGLILLSAFYSDKNMETQNGRKLKTIAKLLLVSSVSFVSLFLVLEILTKLDSTTLAGVIVIFFTFGAILAASVSFAIALTMLISSIKYM